MSESEFHEMPSGAPRVELVDRGYRLAQPTCGFGRITSVGWNERSEFHHVSGCHTWVGNNGGYRFAQPTLRTTTNYYELLRTTTNYYELLRTTTNYYELRTALCNGAGHGGYAPLHPPYEFVNLAEVILTWPCRIIGVCGLRAGAISSPVNLYERSRSDLLIRHIHVLRESVCGGASELAVQH